MKAKNFITLLSILLITSALASCESSHTHSFDEWDITKEATCSENGQRRRKCLECGYTEIAAIDSPAHSFVESVTTPECDKQGFTTYTCECGYSYIGNYVAPLTHRFSAKKTEPTCETQGYTTYTCECGYSYKKDFILPIGHKLDLKTTAPTCTEEGFTHYSCKLCDYEFDSDFVAPTAHKNSQIQLFRPTVIRDGYSVHTCTDCGYTYNGDYVAYSSILPSAKVENKEILQKGIDVSHWNHKKDANGNFIPLDWAALKAAGVDFVIINAGDSVNGIEETFEMDYTGAKAAGLDVGAYFYAYSTTINNTLADANALLGWLEGKRFEYPIYFDLEDDTLAGIEQEYLSKLCLTFADIMQSHGYYCGLYVNNNWLVNILNTELIKSKFDIWYARYTGQPSEPAKDYYVAFDAEPLVWNEEKFGYQLGMWQYTQYGKIDGFDCYFDFNYSYKNYEEIMKEWGLNGF